jgi:hypothetical protein
MSTLGFDRIRSDFQSKGTRLLEKEERGLNSEKIKESSLMIGVEMKMAFNFSGNSKNFEMFTLLFSQTLQKVKDLYALYKSFWKNLSFIMKFFPFLGKLRDIS